MIQTKSKIMEETTKAVVLTPTSSVKSSVTVDSGSPSETRDSSYFPGCRKDAHCKCEFCVASINAILDLMPTSAQRSTLTKFSATRLAILRSPVSFSPESDPSTPKSSSVVRTATVSPPLSSAERVSLKEKVKRRNGELGYGSFIGTAFWCLILALVVEYGVSWMVSGVVKARLSPNVIKDLGERSRSYESLNGRFEFLKNEVEGLVGTVTSSCSSVDSLWKTSEYGLLLKSRCVLYKSMVEEVSIWGWPLQAAGLLEAGYSSRSFSIISGSVAEWSNGEAKFSVREANSSWAQGKWASSVVQLDPNTWILEYRRSFLMDNARLVSAALEFLKHRLTIEFRKMKWEFWQLSAFGRQEFDYMGGRIETPT